MTTTAKKLGRRPGQTGTKQKILSSAEDLFARYGYDQTTVRSIAEIAGVDPALVIHYFGTKEELFVAAMTPTQDVPHKISSVLGGDPESMGLGLATLFVTMLDGKATNHIIVNALKAAIRIPGAASLIKVVLVRPILKTFKESALDNAELRATLAQSQLLGIAMSRYILRIEPISSLSSDELITYLAPTLQRYLTGDLKA